MKKLVLLAVMLFGFTAFAQTPEQAYKEAHTKAEKLTDDSVNQLVGVLNITDTDAVAKIKEVVFEKNLMIAQHPDFSNERKAILVEKIEGVLSKILDEKQLKTLKKEEALYNKITR